MLERDKIIELVSSLDESEIKQLKKTLTYKRFSKLFTEIKAGGCSDEASGKILRSVYDMIEDMKGFHFEHRSMCASKCVELIIREKNGK